MNKITKPIVLKKKSTITNAIVVVLLLLISVSHANTITNNLSFFIDQDVNDKHVLEQVIDNCANRNEFNLFSHGRSGELLINGEWKNAQEIANFLKSDFNIQNSTISHLNIYGCEFAKGENGKQAIAYLENALNLKVNASTNITGKDGDWNLEVGDRDFKNFKNYKFNLQLDSTHYIPPFYSPVYDGNYNDENILHLSTPSTTPITVVVTDGAGVPFGSGNNGTAGEYVISEGSPYDITFGDDTTTPLLLDTASVGSILTNKGLTLTSSGSFYVNQKGGGVQQAYSLTSKGTAAVGRHFKWANSHGNGGDNVTGYMTSGHYISLYAVEDTTITLSDYGEGVTFDGAINSDNIDLNDGSNDGETVINLLAGQSIMLRANVNSSLPNQEELIGADILSTGNIVVNAGSNMLPWLNKRDFGIDQIVPINLLGDEYVIIAGGNATQEAVTVTATEDNTEIFVNGSTTPIATINEGEFYDISGSNFTANDNMYFTTSNPVYVYHTLYGNTAPNTVGSNFIPELTCFAPTKVGELTDIFETGTENYNLSSVIITTFAGAEVRINGTLIPAATYESAVTGNTDYVTYKIPYSFVKPLAGTNDTYTLESTRPMAAGVFGGNKFAGFAAYFSGFGDTPLINAGDAAEIAAGGVDPICDPERLALVNTGFWNTFQWYKDGIAIPGATESSTQSIGGGLYHVVVSNDGFCETPSNDLTVLLTPEPVVSERALCNQDNPVQIIATPSGGTFGGGTFITEAGIFDPQAAGLGSHTITYNYTSINGCPVQEVTATITVSSNPELNAPSNPTCINSGTQTLIVSPAGGTFSGPGVNATTGVFDPQVAGVGSHTIYYSVEDSSGSGCSGSNSLTLVVKGEPAIQIPDYGPYCLNDSEVQLAATPEGGTYSGAGVSTSGIFNPATAGVGTHTITYAIEESSTTCGSTKTTTIEVLNSSQLVATPVTQTICSGATANIAVTGDNGGTVNWTTDTGLSGTGTSISEVLVNNGTVNKTTVFTINTIIGDCLDTTEAAVIVKPNPSVTSSPQSIIICDFENLVITLSSPLAGTVIDWILKDDLGTTVAFGTGTDTAVVNEPGLASGNYTLEYTGTNNSCTSETYTLPVTVN